MKIKLCFKSGTTNAQDVRRMQKEEAEEPQLQ